MIAPASSTNTHCTGSPAHEEKTGARHAAGNRCRSRPRACPSVAREARAPHRAVSPGGLDGHPGPFDRAKAAGGARPAVRRGEQRWRGRLDRRHRGGARNARRLHAADGSHRDAGGQSVALSRSCLRPHAELRAGDADRARAQCARRESRGAGTRRAATDLAREVEARRAALRVGRQRQRGAPRDGVLQASHADGHRPYSLSRNLARGRRCHRAGKWR